MIMKTEASDNITDDCDAETDTHTNAASIEDNTNLVTDTSMLRKLQFLRYFGTYFGTYIVLISHAT
jgi:hypothetical protein